MAKVAKPKKISSRDKRAIAKLALRGARDPSSMTYGQIRRLAVALLAQLAAIPTAGRGDHTRGRPRRYKSAAR